MKSSSQRAHFPPCVWLRVYTWGTYDLFLRASFYCGSCNCVEILQKKPFPPPTYIVIAAPTSDPRVRDLSFSAIRILLAVWLSIGKTRTQQREVFDLAYFVSERKKKERQGNTLVQVSLLPFFKLSIC